MVEVEVEFKYEGEQEDELSISIGDIIKNVVMSEGGWWEGELNGKKGMFPDNFVKVIKEKKDVKKEETKKDVQASKRQSVRDLANKIKSQVPENPVVGRRKDVPHVSTKLKKAKVTFTYEPENEDELKLEVGETVEIKSQVEEGWWEGLLNGKSGMFPSNFVELIEDDDGSPSEKAEDVNPIKGKKIMGVGLGNIFSEGPIKLRSTVSKKPGEKPEPKEKKPDEEPVVMRRKQQEKAVVRYSYAAENEDELTLQEGDIVTILEKELEDSGWWKGQVHGKVGVFPDNFVDLVKEEVKEPPKEKVPPRPASVIAPQPQPKPKKPPPPTSVPAIKQVPKLPDKGPVTDTVKPEPHKPEHKHEHKEEKHQLPAVPAKKALHVPPPGPPIGKKPHKPTEPPKHIDHHRHDRGKERDDSPETKKEESSVGLDVVEPTGERLVHLTANRVKGPSKRPPSQDNETNGDVKEPSWLKEDRTTIGSTHHTNIPSTISEPVREKPQTPPSRPPEPSAATGAMHASMQAAMDELRREMKELRTHSVSKAAFNELKADNEQLKSDMDSMKSTYSRRLKDIMTEVDEEKKLRLGTQVEIERIRKLVAESHV